MANVDIEMNPVDFITVGTVGPKGKRIFHLQAGLGPQVVSLTIEKEQARALGEAIDDLLEGLQRDHPEQGMVSVNMNRMTMDLRDPIDPQFRVSQLGLGYDQENDRVILVAREMIIVSEGQDPELAEAGVVRLWATRQQMRALALHTTEIVKQGRVDPQSNGRLLYYWT